MHPCAGSQPGVDREAFAELGDEDFVLGALVLFECLLAVLCA